jgi:hypothetical protein
LSELSERIALFIDEIDVVMALAFDKDDFFASIRAMYNARSEDPRWRRITFCLLGVAAPSDLMTDPARTPFNIGKSIQLQDFSYAEVGVFEAGLSQSHGHSQAQALLQAVYAWTSGHPYMTQRVCEELTRRCSRDIAEPSESVRQIVQEVFLCRKHADDPNFVVAEKLFMRSELQGQMLRLYRRLLQGQQFQTNFDNPLHLTLWLTGMVASRLRGEIYILEVRNAIFAAVFDRQWVAQHEQERQISEALDRWLQAERHRDYVLRGKALREAQAWAEGRDDISPEERGFLIAGLEVAREEDALARQAELEQIRRQQIEERAHTQRRAIQILGFMVMVLVAMLGIVGWQYLQIERERDRAQRAETEAKEERDRAKLAEHQARTERDRAKLAEHQARTERDRAKLAEHQARTERDRAKLAEHQARTERDRAETAKREAFAAKRRAETAKREAIARKQRAEDAEEATRMGNMAIQFAQQSGKEKDALTAGIKAVAPLLRENSLPSIQALQGLFAAVNAVQSRQNTRQGTHNYDHSVQRLFPKKGWVTAAAFAPDGKSIITAHGDGLAMLWDTNGRVIRRFEGQNGWVNAAAFSRDGRRIATAARAAGLNSEIYIWSTHTGQILHRLQGKHDATINDVEFSPDDSKILAASSSEVIWLWQIATGQLLTTFNGHRGAVLSATFSPNGQYIASGGDDRNLRLWHTNSGKPIRSPLLGHQGPITSVSFAPDGQYLASASRDSSARIWNIKKHTWSYTLLGHKAPLTAVAFSHDGSMIATASLDHTVWLWDAAIGMKLTSLHGHQQGALSAQFSPDNRFVISGSSDGSARVFPASSQIYLQMACKLLSKYTTNHTIRQNCNLFK